MLPESAKPDSGKTPWNPPEVRNYEITAGLGDRAHPERQASIRSGEDRPQFPDMFLRGAAMAFTSLAW
jgi:hypothetical protein